jgi:hypothetical protein
VRIVPQQEASLFESHYNFNSHWIIINRYELVRMTQQAFVANPGNLGDAGVLTFGRQGRTRAQHLHGNPIHPSFARVRNNCLSRHPPEIQGALWESEHEFIQ